ncbi:MAG: energy transducer TonB [Acidobacteria bacterium]|nr:energy transducer TonB [Acidobacteriota bacterium]MBS1865327.1 energy transducer TonB [Acidobacteriota bacterium]
MAGFDLKLVPDDAIPKNPNAASQAAAPVPANAVPKFGRPEILMPDDFWSNVRQFLFERPIKIRGDYHSPLMPEEYGGGFWNNLKDFFSSKPVPKGSSRGQLANRWDASFGGFGERIKDLFFPEKQAPLPFAVKPVKVKEIWSKRENFGWTQIASIGVHAGVFALIIAALILRITPPTQAVGKDANVTPLDISDYVSKLPAGANKAGGGGGANDHTLTPVNKGKLPKFKMTQFTPPQVRPVNPDPKLAMDPSLLGPPDLKIASPNMPTFGDPLANGNSDSLGHGNGTGIGSGTGGGLGPGEGGGTGGGAFRAGVNGVGVPTCYYHPDPPYSEEARKAKYQGIVVVEAIIETDDRVTNLRVAKSPGLGLDEKTIETVRTWRCKAAMGPNGKPVRTSVPIEVSFRLF